MRKIKPSASGGFVLQLIPLCDNRLVRAHIRRSISLKEGAI
jgi:hypothetical protein